MKYHLLIIILVVFFVFGSYLSKAKSQDISNSLEYRIDSVLQKMTLEEKVGQMAQYTLDVIGKGGAFSNSEPFEIDKDTLDLVIGKYKVGSILNTSNNRARIIEFWQKTIKTIQDKAIETTGIPIIYGIDAIHGETYTAGATLFPQEIGMAATFNPELMKIGSQISAYDTRASNIPWAFSPVLGLGRDARWSRMWETFGEDVYLAKTMGVASVLGFQGNDKNDINNQHVAACLKHYMGYSVPFSGKDRTPSIIDNEDLREKYFEPFRSAVKAGALSVMVNSGILNGISGHANYEFLTTWLKKDLNFDGMVVTDWADVQNLYSRDHIAKNYTEAIKIAINSGIDMVMEPYNLQFCDTLLYLAKTGEIPQERIDDAVRRVLRLKFRVGLFENPYWSYTDYSEFGSKEHEAASKLAAEESITLLKNENNILPLKKGAKILVAGPNGNSMRTLDGAWSYSWQGEKVEEFTQQYNTIYEALQKQFGKNNVKYVAGVTYKMDGKYDEENPPRIQEAVKAAADVDYIVLCVGENSYAETPGNLDELALSDNQIDLAKALQETGKPIILVLNEGRPKLIRRIEPKSQAVLQLYLPGNHGGDALAEILAGEVNPSGRLPYTYPKFEQSLITYDYKPSQNLEGKMDGAYDYGAQTSVQYAFGYGLSYTTFEYSNLISSIVGDTVKVSVDVKNTGKKAGKETVMVFSSDLVASITPDVRRLRAFDKINLTPNETRHVEFRFPVSDLAFVNQYSKWTLEAGEYKIQIGNLTRNIYSNVSKIWETPNK